MNDKVEVLLRSSWYGYSVCLSGFKDMESEINANIRSKRIPKCDYVIDTYTKLKRDFNKHIYSNGYKITFKPNDTDNIKIVDYIDGYNLGKQEPIKKLIENISFMDAKKLYQKLVKGSPTIPVSLTSAQTLDNDIVEFLLDIMQVKNISVKALIGYLVGQLESYILQEDKNFFDATDCKYSESDILQLLDIIAKIGPSQKLTVYKIITKGFDIHATYLWSVAYTKIRSKGAFEAIPKEALKTDNWELFNNILRLEGSSILKWCNGEIKEYGINYINNNPKLIVEKDDLIKYKFKIRGKELSRKEIETLMKLYPDWNEFKEKYILQKNK